MGCHGLGTLRHSRTTKRPAKRKAIKKAREYAHHLLEGELEGRRLVAALAVLVDRMLIEDPDCELLEHPDFVFGDLEAEQAALVVGPVEDLGDFAELEGRQVAVFVPEAVGELLAGQIEGHGELGLGGVDEGLFDQAGVGDDGDGGGGQLRLRL